MRGPRAAWEALTGTERVVSLVLVAGAVGLLAAMVAGVLRPTYFLFLFGLGGMFALLSLGLNAQWGYTGLINFSVGAFFGAGAYGAALTTAGNSPLAGGLPTLLGLVVALAVAAVVAVAIGQPQRRDGEVVRPQPEGRQADGHRDDGRDHERHDEPQQGG